MTSFPPTTITTCTTRKKQTKTTMSVTRTTTTIIKKNESGKMSVNMNEGADLRLLGIKTDHPIKTRMMNRSCKPRLPITTSVKKKMMSKKIDSRNRIVLVPVSPTETTLEKEIETSSDEEEETGKMTRARVISRLEIAGVTTSALQSMTERYEKAIVPLIPFRPGLGATTMKNYVLLWTLDVSSMVPFFRETMLESSLKTSTQSNYWRCAMTAGKVLGMEETNEMRVFGRWLETQIGPADVTKPMTIETAQLIFHTLISKEQFRAAVWMGVSWATAQRPPDILRLRVAEVYLITNLGVDVLYKDCVALRIVEGKTTSRLGPYSVFLPAPHPFTALFMLIVSEALKRNEEYVFGEVRDQSLLTIILRKEMTGGLNQRSIRRGAAQLVAMAGRPTLPEMRRILRHGQDPEKMTMGYLGHGLCAAEWQIRQLQLTAPLLHALENRMCNNNNYPQVTRINLLQAVQLGEGVPEEWLTPSE
jgi:hypothetical protein